MHLGKLRAPRSAPGEEMRESQRLRQTVFSAGMSGGWQHSSDCVEVGASVILESRQGRRDGERTYYPTRGSNGKDQVSWLRTPSLATSSCRGGRGSCRFAEPG